MFVHPNQKIISDRFGAEMVAVRLGVSAGTIHRWARAGRFPKPLRFRNRIFWTEQQIAEFEKQEQTQEAS